jgi:hypothetical protein
MEELDKILEERVNETGVSFYLIDIICSKSNLVVLPCIVANQRIKGRKGERKGEEETRRLSPCPLL